MAHFAEHLAARLDHDRLGVALERVAERVVGGDEEPGVAAGLDDGVAGAVGEHPGVVGPVHGVRRARLSGEVRGGGAGDDERLALIAGDLVHGERDAGVRHVEDHVHLVDVVPLAREARADVGLVLMIGRHDLDPEASLGRAEILDRQAGSDHRPLAGEVGVQARLVVQHANLDDAVGNLGLRPACGQSEGDCGSHFAQSGHRLLLPGWWFRLRDIPAPSACWSRARRSAPCRPRGPARRCNGGRRPSARSENSARREGW